MGYSRFYRTCLFTVTLLAIAFPLHAHEGTTPYRTLGDMKRKGEGPFARNRPYAFALDWLGINAEQIYNANQEPVGVKITHLEEDRPAEEGDLEQGDIIIGINGFTVLDLESLNSLMKKIYFEGDFRFTVLRNEQEVEETLLLKADLPEIDPKLSTMISSRGSSEKDFSKGMFADDFMKIMMGGSPTANKKTTPITAPTGNLGAGKLPSGLSMREMLQRSPQVHFQGEQPTRTRRPRVRARNSQAKLERSLLDINRYIRMRTQLRITDEQVRVLRNLYHNYLKFKLGIEADLAVEQLNLEEALEGNVDLIAAKETISKEQQFRADQHYRLVEYYKILKTILTTEQQTYLGW